MNCSTDFRDAWLAELADCLLHKMEAFPYCYLDDGIMPAEAALMIYQRYVKEEEPI